MIRRAFILVMTACTAGGTASVQAGPVDTLREFVQNVRSGQGRFSSS